MPSALMPERSTNDCPALTCSRARTAWSFKLTVPEEYGRSAAVALGVDPLDAQVRQIFFFDTTLPSTPPGWSCARGAWRRGPTPWSSCGRSYPASCRPSCAGRRASRSSWTRCRAGSSARPRSRAGPTPTSARSRPGTGGSSRLFSKEQRRFYREHAPEGIALDDLTTLGPVMVLKLRYTPKGFAHPLTVELWTYPDGTRILELSTKTTPPEALQTVAEARAFLPRGACPSTASSRPRRGLRWSSSRASLLYVTGTRSCISLMRATSGP